MKGILVVFISLVWAFSSLGSCFIFEKEKSSISNELGSAWIINFVAGIIFLGPISLIFALLSESEEKEESIRDRFEVLNFLRKGDYFYEEVTRTKKYYYTFLGMIDDETLCLFKGKREKIISKNEDVLDYPDRIREIEVSKALKILQFPQPEKRKERASGYEVYNKFKNSSYSEFFDQKNKYLIDAIEEGARSKKYGIEKLEGDEEREKIEV